ILTSISHPTGTDRIAEVCESIAADVYVNVQGDEPLIRPETISACALPLLEDNSIPMGSAFSECLQAEWDNPAAVKVVTDLSGFALYFSRYAVPF
ncbi:3-deoxy-manno-octulosonate cytidylyltransferase, partial [Acinetobacter baumannii]